jgi:hypothetical protein
MNRKEAVEQSKESEKILHECKSPAQKTQPPLLA